MTTPTRTQAMNQDIKDYIDQRDTVVEQRIKMWILSSIIAQFLGLAPIIFFLGGIYQNVNASFALTKSQQAAIETHGTWIRSVDERDLELRAWAKTQGFKPFTPDPGRGQSQ